MSHFDSAQRTRESLHLSPRYSVHTSDAQLLHNLSTIDVQTPAVVNKSTFSKFIPNITILIARANSTNITKEEATSLAKTLSSIPSLKGISNVLNSPDSITRIITNSNPTVKSSGEQTVQQPPPPPPSSASSVQSSFQSHGDDATASASSQASLGKAPPVASSQASPGARAATSTRAAAGTKADAAQATLGSRRNATGTQPIMSDDDTDDDDDDAAAAAASNRKGKSFTNRRHDAPPSLPSAEAFYAKQQVQNARDQAQALPGASRADGTSRAAGATTMTHVPHEQSFMDQSFMSKPFVHKFSHGSATASAAQDQTSRAGAAAAIAAAQATQHPNQPPTDTHHHVEYFNHLHNAWPGGY